MRNYKDFLNEAKLRGSKGIPSDYVSNVDRKAQSDLGIRIDDPSQMREFGPQIMNLIERGSVLLYSGLNRDQIKDRISELEQLAKDVMMSEYGNILDNVNLNIKLINFGDVSSEMSEIGDVPQNPPSENEQKRKMQNDEDEDELLRRLFAQDEEVDKKKSFLDKLFKKEEDEKEEFVGSTDYKERVDKAKLINNIIQGEAKNTKKILHSETVKSGLNRIFGEQKAKQIFKIWDDTTKLADKMDWIIPIEDKARMMSSNTQGMAGAVSVEWPEGNESDEDEEGNEGETSQRSAEEILKDIEDGKELNEIGDEIGDLFSNGNPTINSIGVDFPMLLHETVKGIYELIAAAYLPSDDSDKDEISKSKVIKSAVTSFEDEAEDFRYGPYIAGALRDFVNSCSGSDKYPNMREYVFGRMVLLSPKDFLDLMKGILDKSSDAKKKIEDIISEISDEIREYEVSMIDEPSSSYDDSEDDGYQPQETEEPEEDEIEKLIKKSSNKASDDPNDYSNMSKKQLQELIDNALDSGDFETLRKIQPFMKESLEWRIYESEINSILRKKSK